MISDTFNYGDSKTFYVSRARWLRGEGSQNSRLLRPSDGKMCCLGFYGRACGIPSEQLENAGAPDELVGYYETTVKYRDFWPKWVLQEPEDLGYRMTAATTRAMEVNDDDELGAVEREETLAELFKSVGVELVFVP
jgi:hypothetical protein